MTRLCYKLHIFFSIVNMLNLSISKISDDMLFTKDVISSIYRDLGGNLLLQLRFDENLYFSWVEQEKERLNDIGEEFINTGEDFLSGGCFYILKRDELKSNIIEKQSNNQRKTDDKMDKQ